jgi:hypothetical protein
MVATLVLGTSAFGHGSSTLPLGTEKRLFGVLFLYIENVVRGEYDKRRYILTLFL